MNRETAIKNSLDYYFEKCATVRDLLNLKDEHGNVFLVPAGSYFNGDEFGSYTCLHYRLFRAIHKQDLNCAIHKHPSKVETEGNEVKLCVFRDGKWRYASDVNDLPLSTKIGYNKSPLVLRDNCELPQKYYFLPNL